MIRRLVPALASVAAMLLLATASVTSAQASRKPSSATSGAARLASLRIAVAGPGRTAESRLRDRYRHPLETLNFFGVAPNATVVEIWPARGWYTEILAPYLHSGGGKLFAATSDRSGFDKLKAINPALFAEVTPAVFPVFNAAAPRVPAGSADVVLTFRNVHNWRMGAGRPDKQDYSAEAFRQMFAMLKPGGVLGLVDHRLPERASAERERTSGYMKVSTVRRLAQAAGFRLVASSEVNANPRDTADWPDGVWTLPPSLALHDKDRARYVAIGESDRMTLKFVKPR